ncbi:hypothetical protein [Clostridium tertium]|uniref:Uncharacterized protein n=1 Tax=Clostridium tertium TaxID=1559 RepID=A0A6N3G4V2_9CLOT
MKWRNILIVSVCVISIIFGGIKVFAEGINETKSEIEDLEKVKSETITKTFDGSYMSPLITVSEYKPEFNIKLEGIDKESELILINSYSGEMIKMDYDKDGKYILKTSLEKNVDYGILVDFRLTGSIRVVDNLKEVNDEEIYKDIMKRIQCGL